MSKRAAVIGRPVKHSLSPMIHNHWLAQYGIEGVYDAIDIAPIDLQERLRQLIDEGYVGFNITIPHKVSVMDICDEIDDVARAIGAVNTIRISNGKVHGSNTDAFGFTENLRDQCAGWDPKAGTVLILGAGGAAQAAVYALKQAGVNDIILANRTQSKAALLGRSVPWEDRNSVARDATMIVNTTSLGMTGQQPLDMDLSDSRAIIYDIVYRPLMTPLLRQAQDKNLPMVTGLGMLLQQARPAFKCWFGILPDVDKALQEKILKAAA